MAILLPPNRFLRYSGIVVTWVGGGGQRESFQHPSLTYSNCCNVHHYPASTRPIAPNLGDLKDEEVGVQRKRGSTRGVSPSISP